MAIINGNWLYLVVSIELLLEIIILKQSSLDNARKTKVNKSPLKIFIKQTILSLKFKLLKESLDIIFILWIIK